MKTVIFLFCILAFNINAQQLDYNLIIYHSSNEEASDMDEDANGWVRPGLMLYNGDTVKAICRSAMNDEENHCYRIVDTESLSHWKGREGHDWTVYHCMSTSCEVKFAYNNENNDAYYMTWKEPESPGGHWITKQAIFINTGKFDELINNKLSKSIN